MDWIDRPIEPPKARVRGIHRRIDNRGHQRRRTQTRPVEIGDGVSPLDWQIDEYGNLSRTVSHEVSA